MKRAMMALLGTAILSAVTGCISVNTVSSPPLDTKGQYNPLSEVVVLSQGVAIGFECHNSWGNSCEDLVITSTDPKVARIMPMHLDKYRSSYGHVSPVDSARSTFVIAGISPGKTQITLVSEDGDETFEVVVE